MGGNIFKQSNKGLTSKIYKTAHGDQHQKSTLIKKWGKDLNIHLSLLTSYKYFLHFHFLDLLEMCGFQKFFKLVPHFLGFYSLGFYVISFLFGCKNRVRTKVQFYNSGTESQYIRNRYGYTDFTPGIKKYYIYFFTQKEFKPIQGGKCHD